MSNRSKFADIIATKTSTSKKESDDLLVVFTESLKEQLKTQGEAVFPGFGRLKVHTRPARAGVNPKTGEAIRIAEKQVLKFKPFPKGLE